MGCKMNKINNGEKNKNQKNIYRQTGITNLNIHVSLHSQVSTNPSAPPQWFDQGLIFPFWFLIFDFFSSSHLWTLSEQTVVFLRLNFIRNLSKWWGWWWSQNTIICKMMTMMTTMMGWNEVFGLKLYLSWLKFRSIIYITVFIITHSSSSFLVCCRCHHSHGLIL